MKIFLTGLFIAAITLNVCAEPKVILAKDCDSLQAAINAAPQGGMVQLPVGRIEITEPLRVHGEDLRIQGHGTATHIVNMNENGQPAVLLQPEGIEENSQKRIWRLQLADFRISGSTRSGDGVKAVGVNELLISNLSVDHHGENGIHLIDCYENPRISNSMITYNKKAGLRMVRGHDIVVNANQFEENQNGVECLDSFNLTMNGNNLDDHLLHGVVIENTYGSVLSGNMIEECQGYGMVLGRDCYGITLSANVLAHNFDGGIHFKDAWGCSTTGNTFTINKPFGIVIGPDSGRIAITGNNFSNAFVGNNTTKRDDPAGGVRLNGARFVTITGNVFTGLSTRAVLTEGGVHGIVVQANVMATPFAPKLKGLSPLNLNPTDGIREGNYIERDEK